MNKATNKQVIVTAAVTTLVLCGINTFKIVRTERKKRQKIQEDLVKDLAATQKTREQMLERLEDPNYKLPSIEQLMYDMKFGFIVNRED